MAWRKWFIRLIVLLLIASGGAGWWIYRAWMSPQAVRLAVLEELARRLPGAIVHLQSAEFRLFGGVRLRNLTLARQDDPSGTPFAVLPEVVCYPDKEQLARGKLILRKIEIERPQVMLTRHTDGNWNLLGLAAPQQAAADAAAIVEIRQASLVVAESTQLGKSLHFNNLDVALLPKSLDRNGRAAENLYEMRLSGDSDLVGRLSLEGTLNADSGEMAVAFRLPEILVRPQITRQFADCAGVAIDTLPDFEGVAGIVGTLAHRPGAARPWTHSARMTLRQGQFRHPQLPVPLRELDGTLNLDDGQVRIERMSGLVGDGRISVTGNLDLAAGGICAELETRVDAFRVTEALYDKLPPQSRKLCHDFHPLGPVSLVATLTITDGKLDVPQYVVHLQGVSILFAEFPYPVQDLTGAMSYSEASDPPTLRLNLVGVANRRPVAIKGKVFGPGLRLACDWKPGQELEISGDNIPIDEKFYTALARYPQTLRVAREFHPTGLVNIHAEVRRPAATNAAERPKPNHHLTLRFHHAAFCYQQFPYPQEDVTGTLELWLPQEVWRFHDFVGRHQGGTFSGWAESRAGEPANANRQTDRRTITIDIQGTNVLLNQEIETALDPEMKEAWQHFRPTGRIDCRAIVRLCEAARPDLNLTVDARGCSVKPTCFPYQLGVVRGRFHYAKQRLTITDIDAWHHGSHVTLESALVDLLPRGGSHSDIRNLCADPVTVDADFLQALPGLVRSTFATLRPNQPIRLSTDLIVHDPGANGPTHYKWDGHIACVDCRWQCGVDVANVTGLVALRGQYTDKGLDAIGNIDLATATLAKQPLHKVKGQLLILKDVLQMDGLSATLHGGDIHCPLFRVQFGDKTKYWLKAVGSQIDLQHFAQEGLNRKGQVQGKADVELTLSGQGNDVSTLEGEGSIRVPDGARLYDLPLVIDLLTFLSGKLPKGSAFQEAAGEFSIEGERLKVRKMELLGDALSLRGQGEMRVDGGDMNLEMYGLLWGRQLPLLPPLLDQVQPAISKRLMKIRVQGSLAGAQVSAEPLPVVMEPLRALWQRLRD